jgi:hypothetical protein
MWFRLREGSSAKHEQSLERIHRESRSHGKISQSGQLGRGIFTQRDIKKAEKKKRIMGCDNEGEAMQLVRKKGRARGPPSSSFQMEQEYQ